MKISQQLRGTAIGILLIGSSSLTSVYFNSLGDDSKVINSAGIVRGGTQRLVKLELAGQTSEKLIKKQNKLVEGLINGDSTLGLPTAEISVDRVDQMLELLKQANETTRRNSLGISSLQEKIMSISNHIDSLEKQTIKIAKAAIPASSRLVNTGIDRQSRHDNSVNRGKDIPQDIKKLFNNLQSSIAVMKIVTTDSANILEIEVASTQKNAADLDQAISTIDFLYLNNQQIITTSKQYTSAVSQVTILIDHLNTGAQDTASSISQIKLSASQLGKTTDALQTKI